MIDLPDREPLNEREIKRVALEIAIGVFVWALVMYVVVDLPDWMRLGATFAGAIAVALAIGWWRIVRFGPEGRPRRKI
jgi:hypothetical protein